MTLPTTSHPERLAELSPQARRELLAELLKKKAATQPLAAPLSFAQQRLWLIEKLDPGRPVYNICRWLELAGPLPAKTLADALAALAARHEALRTRFEEVGGQALQRVEERCRLLPAVVDLSGLAEPRLEAERLARTEARRAFDLGRAPLARARLLRFGPQRHALLLTFHHIIVDGWSVALFFREFATAFRAVAAGQSPALPELHLSYRDFARRQRERLAGELEDRQLAYWKERLTDLEESQLPPDRPRQGVGNFSGALATIRFSAQESRALGALARRHQASLFMVLLAAFKVALARVSGSFDLALGVGIANRNQAELEGLLGFFVNSLVMRTRLDGSPSFAEALERVRRTALGAYDHQDLPFDKLVEELNPERYLNHNPLFRIILAMQNLPSSQLELPGLEAMLRPVHSGTSKFELFLDFKEAGGELEGSCEYSSELYDRSTVVRFLAAFKRLALAAAAEPSRSIAALPLAGEAERHQCCYEWNDTARPYPAGETLAALFAAQAAAAPEAIALVQDLEATSYGELARRVRRGAAALVALGVAPGDRVAVRGDRGPELVAALLAIAHAGAAFLPLEAGLPGARLRQVLELAGVRLLLGELPPGCERPPGLVAQPLALSGESELATPLGDGGDLAYGMFTSGSSGLPKGVSVPHRAIARLVIGTDFLRFGPGETQLLLAPTSFDASTLEIWGALLTGGRLVIAPPEQPSLAELSRLLAEQKVTTLWLTAGLFHAMVDEELAGLAGLGQLLAGGDVLSPERVARFLASSSGLLVNGYGPTENTTFSCCHTLRRAAELGPGAVPIGRPITNSRAHLLDRWLHPVGVGAVGELWAGGEGLALGYLGSPRQTAERFRPDPFSGTALAPPGSRLYATGDLARFSRDGSVEFLGRRDQQVKIRGFRVELAEIESQLLRHGAVEAAAVVPRPGPGGSQELLAYVVADPDYQEPTGPLAAEGSTAEIGREQVAHWQLVFDEAYGHFEAGEAALDPTFNIAGWNSSYTDAPIPAKEMREWRDATVERIRGLGGRRLLEIGCGTGLLLFRLADHAERYLATDFSTVALEHIARHRHRLARPQALELALRRADDFRGLGLESFDTVVLNSVVQYFPNARYLERVMAGALEVLADGGCLFLGDLRHLPLADAFALGIELAHADAELPSSAVARRLRRRLAREEELALDPAFFFAFAKQHPRVAEVQVLVKRGRADHEMNRYRYDVVLRVGDRERCEPVAAALDWRRGRLGWADLSRRLRDERPEALLLSHLGNGRLSADLEALRLLTQGLAPERASELAHLASQVAAAGAGAPGAALAPEELGQLAEELGYQLTLSWARSGPEGLMDALFSRPGTRWALPEPAIDPARPLRSYASRPLSGRFARTLAPELGRLLSERLPEYMVPSSFVLLDRLPLTANGKLDRRALPQPETGEGEEGATIEDPLEELIAGIWQEVLGLPRVGTTVSFFELGGHSLLATQVISRLKSSFGVDVPLRALFANPTVAGLAVALKAALAGRQGGTEPVLSAPRRQPGQDLPASFAQERLWFLACLAPGSTVYNMPAGLHLLGPLSPRELARALTGLVARHEALRTTFEARDGRPLQRIHPPAAVPLPLVDLSGLEAEGRLERVRELAAREIRRPFDLERGPLLRATLVRMAPAEHALLLSQHHIVSDGWSIGVLLADLGRLLRLGRGEAAALPELALQYADFALWQRERLQGEALESLLGAWRKRLSGAPPWLELPLDRPRPALQTFHGASFSFELPAPLGNRLEAFARERQATAYMVLLAVFATLLERLSGARDLLIGSPIANRNRAEIEHLVGFFVNTLVMRLRPRPERSLDELSAEVRATTLDAYAHQDLPFERLVEELAPERNPAVSPLFQVMFAVQNALRRPPELPGLEVRRLGRRSTTAMFDLALTFEPLEGRWAGRLVYNTDLFDGTTAQRLAQAFERLLAGSLTHPERPLGSLPSLSKGERHQLLLEWPAQEVLAPCQASPLIEQQILEQASAMPDRVALEAGTELVSYGGLAEAAARLAGRLAELGASPERPVVCLAERSVELVVALLAVLRAGGVYVPLSRQDPPERRERILKDLDRHLPGALFVASRALGSELGRPAAILEDLLAAGSARPPASRPPEPANAAYVLYTSGSTGEPKGVVVTRASLAHRIAYQAATELEPEDRFLNKASLGFDVFLAETLAPLAAGCRLVLARPGSEGEPRELARTLAERRVSLASFPPTLLASLLEEPALYQAQALRCLFTGGEAVPLELARRVGRELPVALLNRYGPTETTISVASWRAGSGPEPRTLPIGRPLAGARLRLLDGRLEPVPLGAVGELAIGESAPGSLLARGYLGRPGATAERFRPDPFGEAPGSRCYTSGDLARYRPDGALEFVGRRDGQVKIRGLRVELAEVEAALLRLPGVAQAAVADLADPTSGSRKLAAYLVPAAGELDLAEVRRGLAEQLPAHMVPSALVPLGALPLTASGKVDRRALPQPQWRREQVAPTTPLEKRLAGIWQQLLGVDSVGALDDFFELGGHSLLAARLSASVADELGGELTILQIFEHPTLCAQARLLEQSGTEALAAEAAEKPGRGALARQIAAIFGEVLGATVTDDHADFFAQGGSREQAEEALARVRRRLGQEVELAAFPGELTVAGVASELRALSWQRMMAKIPELPAPRYQLVAIKPTGSEPPLLMVSTLRGILPFPAWRGLINLAPLMPPELPLYGIQMPGLAQHLAPALMRPEPLSPGELEALLAEVDPGALLRGAAVVRERLQELQPRGPYSLGGICSGGFVAYEVACQLLERGEEVASLVLVDTTPVVQRLRPPEDPDYPPAGKLGYFAARTLNDTGVPLATELAELRRELARLAPEQRWARALAELKGAGLVRPDTGPRELERVFQMFQMNQRTIAEILRHYYPRRYDGPLTVIHAAEADRLSADPSLGWQPLCSRPVEMVETPGDHGTIFSRHFRELGERLLKAVATGRQAQAGKARGPAGRPVDLAGFGRGR